MISTATAFTTPNTQPCAWPDRPQASRVTTAAATTASTKPPATRSAMLCIGARERCACATSRTICASSVCAPTFCERMTRLPWRLSVAPISASPGRLSTGSGSPVSIDSSTALAPSTTTPSTGTFSPGRTRSRSPMCTCASGMSCSRPSGSMRRAVFGASPSSDLIAADVLERAFSSSICPSRVNETMTAAASKYTATRPIDTNAPGNAPGATVATTLYR